jgi:hypothetical protein
MDLLLQDLQIIEKNFKLWTQDQLLLSLNNFFESHHELIQDEPQSPSMKNPFDDEEEKELFDTYRKIMKKEPHLQISSNDTLSRNSSSRKVGSLNRLRPKNQANESEFQYVLKSRERLPDLNHLNVMDYDLLIDNLVL